MIYFLVVVGVVLLVLALRALSAWMTKRPRRASRYTSAGDDGLDFSTYSAGPADSGPPSAGYSAGGGEFGGAGASGDWSGGDSGSGGDGGGGGGDGGD